MTRVRCSIARASVCRSVCTSFRTLRLIAGLGEVAQKFVEVVQVTDGFGQQFLVERSGALHTRPHRDTDLISQIIVDVFVRQSLDLLRR